MTKTILKTCESVCAGHPDKICDQISDAVLDACLSQDPSSRVACECLIKDDNLIMAGEITSNAQVDYVGIAKQTLKEIGYTPEEVDGFKIQSLISKQSPDIAQGVDAGGAGDQGMMYGYASAETEELLPLPLVLAHNLCRKLADLRQSDQNSPLKPDGKAQVTIRYENGRPVAADAIVVSTQHSAEISQYDLEQYVLKNVIIPVAGDWLVAGLTVNPHLKKSLAEPTKIFINPTGRFEVGGPFGDCGVTGRKIVVDTYGGIGRVGGGAFSGKDPSKVDRSAAYMARYLAKKLVSLGYGDEIEVRLAYAIGVAQPIDVSVDVITSVAEDSLNLKAKPALDPVAYILANFDLSPAGIIKLLDLRQPVYRQTAAYGHFGRSEFSWEK
ncbi:MAG: methionine adenosyltransferase [Patescibacteria group bacterium]|jgi:S-adenosylmethionine synthetase